MFLVLLCSAVHAQVENGPRPVTSPTGALPDAIFRSVVERPVIVRTADGAELAARILTVEASTVTVALSPSGTVVTLDRSKILEVRLPAPPSPSLEPAVPSSFPEANTKRDYPFALIDRPLTLPRLMFETTVFADLTNANPAESAGGGLFGAYSESTSAALGAQISVGVARRLQIGVSVAFPLTDFGQIVANVQYQPARTIALRFDVGYLRAQTAADNNLGGSYPSPDDMFYVALGAVLKWKLHRFFAITSGITRWPGIHVTADENGGFFLGSMGDPNAILAVAGDGATHLLVTFQIPIGLLFQPDRHFFVQLRSGFRLSYAEASNDPSNPMNPLQVAIPVGLDVGVTPIRQLDIGVSFDVPGVVNTSGNTDLVNPSWGDVRLFSFWIALRL